MNPRERFLRTFQFKEVDRTPNFEFGYWNETIDKWHSEGLPFSKKINRDIEIFLGLEGYMSLERLPIRNGLWPPLPERIIKEDENRETVDDGMGGIYLRMIGKSSVPEYLRYPIRTKEDWEKPRPFFDPDTPRRFL